MSEDPIFPPIPDIGDIMGRKDRFIEKKYSVVKCRQCQANVTRTFKAGDYTFKKLPEEACEKCKAPKVLSIVEIYSEWIDPKKKKA